MSERWLSDYPHTRTPRRRTRLSAIAAGIALGLGAGAYLTGTEPVWGMLFMVAGVVTLAVWGVEK